MSSHSSHHTVSDALLDAQQNTNRLLNVKRFGILLTIVTLFCSILLPYHLVFAIAAILLAAFIGLSQQIISPLYELLIPLITPIVNLILAILFYIVLSPLALLIRRLGFDLLQQKLQPEMDSYWNKRNGMIPHGKFMNNQK